MKKLISALLFLMACSNAIAQNSYYHKDTLYVSGINIQDKSAKENAKSFFVNLNNNFDEFFPDSVFEYCINDQKQYFSKNINIGNTSKQVFLQVLHQDSLKQTLYLYADSTGYTYFVENKHGNLVQLQRNSKLNRNKLSEQLESITDDCKEVKEATQWVKYNYNSFKLFFKRYSNCDPKPFPRFKFGVLAGYEMSVISTNSDNKELLINELDYSFESNYTTGIFIDLPFELSNYSIHSELSFSRHSFYSNKALDEYDIDFSIKKSTIKLPVLLRYTLPKIKIRPFANSGLVFASNFDREHTLYMISKNDRTVEGKRLYKVGAHEPSTQVPEFQVGFALGAGLEYKINARNFISFEIRGIRMFATNKNSIGNTDLQFLTALNF